jgi:transcriptional regulator NrdR family protein
MSRSFEMTMQCPACKHTFKLKDATKLGHRLAPNTFGLTSLDSQDIWIECTNCRFRFTSIEELNQTIILGHAEGDQS